MNYLTMKKSLLAKGLNFSLPLKYLDYTDYLVNFELFCRHTLNYCILSNEDIDFVKIRTKETALFLTAMYHNIFLKKTFLLYKIYIKIKYCHPKIS